MKANKEKIGVMLVDDHAIFRMGLVSLLGTVEEIEVVGDAGDGNAAIAKALELRPDVILMDMLMPNGPDGSETTRLLLKRWPEAKVVILTTYETADGIRAREGGDGLSGDARDQSDVRFRRGRHRLGQAPLP